ATTKAQDINNLMMGSGGSIEIQKLVKKLEALKKINQGFGFHLRNTGLDFTDTQIFANAIQKVSRQGFVLEII
ncbi:MAG: hypothetical protein CL914_00870, partial [Deltaproteobacteria bacterium]|nr:hypothetical protein [Deltaproteobacteria bacterium]